MNNKLRYSIAVILFVSLISACGKDTKEETPAAEPTPPPPVEQPAAPVEPAPPVAPEPPQPEAPAPAEPLPLPPPPPESSAPPETPARPAPARPSAKANLDWTVQVGAFAKSRNAEELVGALRKKGFQARTAQAAVNGQTVHRVYVGRFASRKEAEAFQKREMAKEGFSGTFPVNLGSKKITY